MTRIRRSEASSRVSIAGLLKKSVASICLSGMGTVFGAVPTGTSNDISKSGATKLRSIHV
jgi:hypothetical protein